MNTELRKTIIDELEKFMDQHGLSANDVAKKTGVNAGYLSNMRAGNYTINAANGSTVDIADKYFEALANLIGYRLEKTYWETVPTPQMKRMLATLEDAKHFGYTNVIIGETGSGKTYVAGLFARNHPVDCFTVKVGSSDNISDILEKVCEKVHIPVEKTKSKTLRSISRKLGMMKADGHKPMLIFDEAEYMKQPALCNMKELYDNLNGLCAVILMGTDQLTSHLEKMRRKNKDGIPQLYRRIRFGIRVLPTIDRTFKQFLNGITNDREIAAFVREHCDNYGELHDVLVPAMREASRTGEPLSVNLIRVMLNMPVSTALNQQ